MPHVLTIRYNRGLSQKDGEVTKNEIIRLNRSLAEIEDLDERQRRTPEIEAKIKRLQHSKNLFPEPLNSVLASCFEWDDANLMYFCEGEEDDIFEAGQNYDKIVELFKCKSMLGRFIRCMRLSHDGPVMGRRKLLKKIIRRLRISAKIAKSRCTYEQQFAQIQCSQMDGASLDYENFAKQVYPSDAFDGQGFLDAQKGGLVKST